MEGKLGIVTGLGPLTEEAVDLIEQAQIEYQRYTITPGHPLITGIAGLYKFIAGFLPATRKAIGINPFSFTEIAETLNSGNVKRLLFIADLPVTRFIQIERSSDRFDEMRSVADDLCQSYFDKTDPRYHYTMRYFVALSEFLSDTLQIRCLFSREVLPELNVEEIDTTTESRPPPELLRQLPDLVVKISAELSSVFETRTRLSQSVVVDNGIIRQIETTGTDPMLRKYAAMRTLKVFPLLFKLPSPDFHPALDQPTFGPRTIVECHAAGIRGIIACHETTNVISKSETIRQAKIHKIFLHLISFSQLRTAYLSAHPQSWVASVPTIDVPLTR